MPPPQGDPYTLEIRAVRDLPELRRAFATIAPLFAASLNAEQDFRLDRLIDHFPDDRELMLIAEDADAQLRGAALGYRESVAGVKLQALAVQPKFRRHGVATRLVRELESRALRAGAATVYLGAEESALPFYTALGYRGRHDKVLSKSLTGAALAASPQARHDRLMALRAARAARRADT